MTTLKYDPDWEKAASPILEMRKTMPPPPVHDWQGRRDMIAGLFGNLIGAMPDAPEIQTTEHKIKSYDGADISVYSFIKKGSAATPGPAVVHYHGGGMIGGSVPMMSKAIALQAQNTGVSFFSVDYRLAPEHPHPTPVEDCYAGLVWLHEHAKEFNVDPARIAVSGESAGGGLAAGVAVVARDRKISPPLAKQVLIYPMLDDRNTVSDPVLEPMLIWDTNSNITGWTALLGDKCGKDGVSPYAAPARVESVVGLPPTYIDTGDLDLFRNEDIAYAGRLGAANIPIELHIYPGIPHGFEAIGADSEATKRAMANRLKAMTTF